MRRLVAIALLAGCGSGSPVADMHGLTPRTVSAEMASLGWLEGDWDRMHWRFAGDSLYGVTLDGGAFSTMIIDDVNAKELHLYWSTGGGEQVDMAGAAGNNVVSFHDRNAPGSPAVSLRSNHTNELELRVDIADAIVSDRFKRRTPPAENAPELETADRTFSAQVGTRGIDGWMEAFEPTGTMLSKGKPVSGTAMRDVMKPLLDTGTLRWAPIASGVADTIGFTVGTAKFEAKDAPKDNWQSSYVTIWAKQTDGSWKVRFDTGRPIVKNTK